LSLIWLVGGALECRSCLTSQRSSSPPLAQTLEVYKQEAGRWLLLDTLKADARVRAEPFDAVEFDLATLWAR